MFCRYCGNQLPDDARFCNNCGNPVAEPEPAIHEPEPSKEDVPKQEAPKIVEMPKEAAPSIDWKTASRLDRELHRNSGVGISSSSMSPKAMKDLINTAAIKVPTKFKYLIPVIVVAGILLVALIWFFVDNAKKPGHVSESGDYTLQMNDAFQFKSTKSSIRFERVAFDKPQYDSDSNVLTAPMTFVLRVDIPGKKYKDMYAEWLNDFSVNGTRATCSVIRYRPDSDDCYLEYSVHYNSVPADESYLLTCNVNNRLSLHFSYDQSFWENVNYEEALAVGQSTLDAEYGITYIDWQNGANALSYVEDKVYCMTGKVVSCGEYMWGITDQYYITLAAKGALVDTHCYFSRDEWNRSPDIKAGDIVSFYGTFKFESFGWNFEDCTFASPAGTFTVDGASNPASPSISSNPTSVQGSDLDSNGLLPSIAVDTSWPLGYFEKKTGEALDIGYGSGDDVFTFDFYSQGQEYYYGSSAWTNPDFSFIVDSLDVTSNCWNLRIENTSLTVMVFDDRLSVWGGDIGGVSGNAINGDYYCKIQAIQP